MSDIITQRELWNAATETEQRAAIDSISKANPQLLELFEFIELASFECASIRNTVAVFRHRQTGMIFHLLPGELKFKPGITAEQAAMVVEQFGANEAQVTKNEVILYPAYTIRISPFLISRFVVTEAVWDMGCGSKLKRYYGADCAADSIHRDWAQGFASHLGLSLPSEMQWTYACRAGSQGIFYWGDEADLSMAWTEDNFDFSNGYRTLTEAEQKPANAFGLRGMIGHVSEWVADDIHYSKAPFAPTQQPLDYGEPSDGVLRGGGVIYGWKYNRSTSRIGSSTKVDQAVGFRLAMWLNLPDDPTAA